MRVLLGKQELPAGAQTGLLRASVFAFPLYQEGHLYLFNTLTRRLVEVPPFCAQWFFPGQRVAAGELPEDAAADDRGKLLRELTEEWYLVPEDTCESDLYLEIRDVMRLKEEVPDGLDHAVILPTSACNARCFYCFEQGLEWRHMDEKTLEALIEYLLHHLSEDRKIHLSWFGGEPLMAADHIDRICERLDQEQVKYTSDMITNGSLLNEEMIHRAEERWHCHDIQITLDGCREEYERRKQYITAVKDPFQTVIRNMHTLVSSGTDVVMKVRLNLDADNIADLYHCVDYLSETFTVQEKEKMEVYVHELFGQICGDGSCGNLAPSSLSSAVDPIGPGNASAIEEPSIELLTQVEHLNDYIRRVFKKESVKETEVSEKQPGFIRPLPEIFRFKTTFCMADRAQNNVVIDSLGRLYTCEGMPQTLCYGTVFDGITRPQVWTAASDEMQMDPRCMQCVYLPLCTNFMLCPNRFPDGLCRWQQEYQLKKELKEIIREHVSSRNSGSGDCPG